MGDADSIPDLFVSDGRCAINIDYRLDCPAGGNTDCWIEVQFVSRKCADSLAYKLIPEAMFNANAGYGYSGGTTIETVTAAATLVRPSGV